MSMNLPTILRGTLSLVSVRLRSKSLVVFRPRCSVCGRSSVTIRIVSRDGSIYIVYSGLEGGTGWGGDPASSAVVEATKRAFTPPYSTVSIKAAGFSDDAGFCDLCESFYCSRHWNISNTGGGTCPKGHFKSLDPHWRPDDSTHT